MILNMSRLKEERIAKVIARAGLCSRREAEKWVRGGRVCINGKVISEPGIVIFSQINVAAIIDIVKNK